MLGRMVWRTNVTPTSDSPASRTNVNIRWQKQIVKLLKVSYDIKDAESTLDSVDTQGTKEHLDLNWEWYAIQLPLH